MNIKMLVQRLPVVFCLVTGITILLPDVSMAVVGNELIAGWSNGSLDMYEFTDSGWLSTNIRFTGVYAVDVAIGDVDNDGANEVVVTWNEGWVDSYEKIDGTWVNDHSIIAPTVKAISAVVGDADNDGKNELLISWDSGWVDSYEYQSGSWLNDHSLAQVVPSHIAVGDADNDGKNEILRAWTVYGWVDSYEYQNGSWINDHSLPAAVPSRIAIGDADNDGKNEVIRSWTTLPWIDSYELRSTGWVNDSTVVWYGPADVAVGDVDNDGKNEVIAGWNAGWIDVYGYNSTTGSWTGEGTVAISYLSVSVAVGDADDAAPVIAAKVDLDPDTLNLSSKGKFVTAYIKDEEGINLLDVATAQVVAIDGIEITPIIGEVKEDNVKFNRSELQNVVSIGETVNILIVGTTTDGDDFEGVSTIRVIDRGKP